MPDMSNYTIKRIKGGTDNCYLVSHGRDAILFDTSSSTTCEMVINECSKYDLKLIVLSHTHFDHAENAAVISEKFGVPVAYHEADDELFDNYDAQPLRSYGLVGFAVLQLSVKALRETNVKRPLNRFYVKDGDTFEEYGFPDIKVVELPGHTKGSIGLLVQDFALLAGDALDNWIRPAKGHLFYDIDVMNKTFGLIRSLGGRTVYYGHGNPTKNGYRFIGDRLSAPEDILLDYDGGEISPWRCTSRGSLAAFIDSAYRLFVKNFISV